MLVFNFVVAVLNHASPLDYKLQKSRVLKQTQKSAFFHLPLQLPSLPSLCSARRLMCRNSISESPHLPAPCDVWSLGTTARDQRQKVMKSNGLCSPEFWPEGSSQEGFLSGTLKICFLLSTFGPGVVTALLLLVPGCCNFSPLSLSFAQKVCFLNPLGII